MFAEISIEDIPLLQGLTKRQQRKLTKRFVTRTYQAGDHIVTQNQAGTGFFVIARGSTQVVRQKGDGETLVLDTFGPGDFFGELSLLSESPRVASVVATEETTCHVLTRYDFLNAMKESADLSTSVAQTIAKRFQGALETTTG